MPGTMFVDAEKSSRADKLRMAGFVHVTGLPYVGRPTIVQAHKNELGHHDTSNHKAVIVTEDGEVWLGDESALKSTIQWKCAIYQGASVPCSHGEIIDMGLLLDRIADPYSDCGGLYSPVPVIIN